jgi:hypothetical protein
MNRHMFYKMLIAVVPKVWGALPWGGGAQNPQGGGMCETILFTKNK